MESRCSRESAKVRVQWRAVAQSVWSRAGVGVESAKVRVQWRAVGVVGARQSLERSQACSAVQNCGSVEKAGEKSPASDITVRGDRASGRSEQTLRNGRALKRASTLESKGPFVPLRRRRQGPIHQAAWRGLGQPSRGYTNCRIDGTSRVAQRVTTRVAGNQHGLSDLLRSPQLREH